MVSLLHPRLFKTLCESREPIRGMLLCWFVHSSILSLTNQHCIHQDPISSAFFGFWFDLLSRKNARRVDSVFPTCTQTRFIHDDPTSDPSYITDCLCVSISLHMQPFIGDPSYRGRPEQVSYKLQRCRSGSVIQCDIWDTVSVLQQPYVRSK